MQFQVENRKIKPIMQILKDNIHQGYLQIDEDGIQILTADPANTIMFTIDIESDFFDEFDAEKDEHESYLDPKDDTLYVGLQLDHIYGILKKFSKDDDMVFSLIGEEFTIASGDDVISLPTLNLNRSDQIVEVDHIELPTEFEVEASTFVDKVKILSVYEDQVVTLNVDQDKLNLDVDADVGSASTKMDLESWNNEKSVAYYQDHLLENVSTAIKRLHSKEDILKMRVGDQAPLETQLSKENLNFSMYLAPRIKED
jgi:hypothetical protein